MNKFSYLFIYKICIYTKSMDIDIFKKNKYILSTEVIPVANTFDFGSLTIMAYKSWEAMCAVSSRL